MQKPVATRGSPSPTRTPLAASIRSSKTSRLVSSSQPLASSTPFTNSSNLRATRGSAWSILAKAACDTRIANYATKRAQDLALKHAREMQDLAAKHEAKCDDRVAREIAALEAELDQVKASAVELDPIETSAVELASVDTSTVDPLAENEFTFFLVDE